MQQPDKKNNLKIQYVHNINDKRTESYVHI